MEILHILFLLSSFSVISEAGKFMNYYKSHYRQASVIPHLNSYYNCQVVYFRIKCTEDGSVQLYSFTFNNIEIVMGLAQNLSLNSSLCRIGRKEKGKDL